MPFIKTFLLAVVGASLLTACGGGSDNNDNETGGVARILFAPSAASPVVPFPFDLFFADGSNAAPAPGLTGDTTLNIPNPPVDPDGPDGPMPPRVNPLITQFNLLDGFSTTATLFTDIALAPVDVASANNGGVVIINRSTGMPLTPGSDFDVVQSNVITGRTRLLIRPLSPLDPATTYIVLLTDALKTVTGGQVQRAFEFEVVSNPNEVGSEGNPVPENYGSDRIAVLEQIRRLLIRPIYDGLIDPSPNLDASSVLMTWSFTTESISDSLDFVEANAPVVPQVIGVNNTGATSGSFGDPTASVDVYSGTVDLASFLAGAAGPNDPTPLQTFWLADPNQSPAGNSTLPNGQGGFIPCAAFARSTSTTGCFPQPSLRATQTVPVLVMVPNANSGQTMPAGGWPVVIFQHGITRNRADALSTAPALARAGFVTVAIDQPLHGITPENAAAPLRIAGLERTYALDLAPTTNSAAGCDQDLRVLGGAPPAPDGVEDCSGAYFNNLGSLVTSRDNLRQAAADLIQLSETLRVGPGEMSGANDIPVVGGPGAGTPINLADDNVHYVGHSLGGIVGGTFLGVSDNARAASLGMPGGGIPGLLDGSAAFGATVSAGLAALAPEGSDTYETFIRFAQTIIDPGDPINYAEAANAAHPLHYIEIVGGANSGANPPDLVVPNFVVRNVAANGVCPATAQFLPFLDTVCEDRVLSGTDPLVATAGVDSVTIEPPYAARATQPTADSVIRFTGGHHGSLITPTTAGTPGVTPEDAFRTFCEIQSQMANFLGQAAAGVPEASLLIPVGVTNCTPPMAP